MNLNSVSPELLFESADRRRRLLVLHHNELPRLTSDSLDLAEVIGLVR